MRCLNSWKVQDHGDVVCYERVGCDSGALCLDWREICDAVQQCMSGVDEENCDLLEMNRCEQEEYRCMNGMCIPDEFFLDGKFDCLDWSDEVQFKKDQNSTDEALSHECDDRVCLPNQWSCGDGQCVDGPLPLQKQVASSARGSQRDQYFMCETRNVLKSWTTPNGRCHWNGPYDASAVVHDNEENLYEYLLECATIFPRRGQLSLSLGIGIRRSSCTTMSSATGSIPTRCSHRSVHVLPLQPDAKSEFPLACSRCHQRNTSSSDIVENRCQRHCANESTDRCHEWNPCMLTTRVKDVWDNCLNEADELNQTEVEIKRSCTRVQRHRFRCSIEQAPCLSVMALGNEQDDCENRFDELWFGIKGRKISDMRCNDRWKDECSLLRQYIEQSWTSTRKNERGAELLIPFRSYYDTFWNLDSKKDEDLAECRRSDDEHWCSRSQLTSRAISP
ncbi:unnamed protein product [Didymodactylos carnosus]|uniref:Uncharacterized protein n=1 Tax=Didymodactylos carnosus TaxID=1234261 RepID=A0A814FLG3_9BILA|nr:unnamed protein product [Didymodactylos carnosus]CAF3756917.1 unnamed protein product [Didymodactylos carnosus]